MSWAEWFCIWAVSLGFSGLVVGLAFAIGPWTFLVVFPLLFVGLGLLVTT